MQDNVKIILLALAVIVVSSFVTNSLTGKASQERRGFKDCWVDEGVTIRSVNDKETWYFNECKGDVYARGYQEGQIIESRIKRYFCSGVDEVGWVVEDCPQGYYCETRNTRYGPNARCVPG